MATDPRYRLPSQVVPGRYAWGGNPPQSFLSADGLMFWGRNEKDDENTWYIIYTISPAGVVREHFKHGPDAGQGILSLDQSDWLKLSIHERTGDDRASLRFDVAGWKRSL